MNKNLIIVLYFVLAFVAVIALALVTLISPVQVDKTVGWVVQILGLASTAAVTIYLLGKQSATLEQVKTNTNGTLSSLREQLAEKDLAIAEQQRQLLQVVGSAPAATVNADGRHAQVD